MPRLETDLGAYIYSPFSPEKLLNGRACFNSFSRFKIFDRLLLDLVVVFWSSMPSVVFSIVS
jgi:hypothetical protein